MNWETVSFVVGSKKRTELFKSLENPKTPSQLAKLLKISPSNIWIKLKTLEERKLIECLTPEVKKGRIYTLTKMGREVLKKVRELEK